MKNKIFLVVVLFIAYAPFLNLRVLRMAGDEKVYVSQSVEMLREGRWFVQTIADEPNYFKGPLHYWFVNLGQIIFGNQLLAGTWMNFLFALALSFSLFIFSKKIWDEKDALLLSVAAGLNVGMFSHALASQMEVELCAFYTFAFIGLLGSSLHASGSIKKPEFKQDSIFWIIVGITGWIKSPVYSVLLGISGIFYWALIHQLRERVLSLKCWLACGLGIFVCILGYCPILISDFKNFFETYLLRENIGKPNNNRAWHYVVLPLLHFSFPWTLILLFSLTKIFKKWPPYLKCALAIALPTIIFWSAWKYKGQNYNLPALPALLFLTWGLLNGKIPPLLFKITAVLSFIFLICTTFVVLHFRPLPHWWHSGWLLLAFLSMCIFIGIFFFSKNIYHLASGAALFFISFGAFIAPLGEREMLDIRTFIKQNPDHTYYYYNLNPSIWSEWGLLQLTLHRPIYGVHKKEKLNQIFYPGNVLLIYDADAGNFFEDYPEKKPQAYPWKRWLTKGKSLDGKSRWREAWDKKDLTTLERDFYIIKF